MYDDFSWVQINLMLQVNLSSVSHAILKHTRQRIPKLSVIYKLPRVMAPADFPSLDMRVHVHDNYIMQVL